MKQWQKHSNSIVVHSCTQVSVLYWKITSLYLIYSCTPLQYIYLAVTLTHSNFQPVRMEFGVFAWGWNNRSHRSFTGQSPRPLSYRTTCRTRLSLYLSICLSPQFSVCIWLIEPYVTQHPSVLCRQLKTNTVQIKLLHATSDWHTEHID